MLLKRLLKKSKVQTRKYWKQS